MVDPAPAPAKGDHGQAGESCPESLYPGGGKPSHGAGCAGADAGPCPAGFSEPFPRFQPLYLRRRGAGEGRGIAVTAADDKRIDMLLRQARDEGANPASRGRAYAEIVRRYQAMAFGLAWGILGDFHLAEDAAQEAFVSAWLHLPQLRRREAFGGWLRRIVVRQCRRMMRVRRPVESALDAAAEPASADPLPPEEAAMREAQRAVRAAIRALPEKHRVALGLYYVDGYSQREVAGFLGVPVGTVKSRLHAGRAMLTERILEMARRELSEAAPGPEFTEQVRRLVRLIDAGEAMPALGLQERLLGQLRTLQEQGRCEEVVRRHQAAMAVVGETPRTGGGLWRTTYGLLAESYLKTGRSAELIDGLRSGIPDEPTPAEIALWAGQALCELVEALHRAGDAEEALAQGRRLIGLVVRARDTAGAAAEGEPLDQAIELLEAGDVGAFAERVSAALSDPEVVLMGLPSRPGIDQVPSVLKRMCQAASVLRRQGRNDRAVSTVRKGLELTERLRGWPEYCFRRVSFLLELARVARARGDPDQARSRKEQVLAELAEGEGGLRAVGQAGAPEPAGADDPTLWRGHLGDAFWQAACVLHAEGLITPAEGLPLVRRAGELHVFGPTEELLARWLLSVEGDREGALEHLGRAMAFAPTVELVRANFTRRDEWAPVRDDRRFRALVGE